MVDDGQIMVLGGLMKDEYSDTMDKVPLLGDIPVHGRAVPRATASARKSNLLVFLRLVVHARPGRRSALSIDRYDAIRADPAGHGAAERQHAGAAAVDAPAPGQLAPRFRTGLDDRGGSLPASRRTLPPTHRHRCRAGRAGIHAAELEARPRHGQPAIPCPTPTRRRTRCCSRTTANA